MQLTQISQGFSVDEHGKQFYLDTTVAYRQACLRVVEYLRRYGYSDYQIYLLLSCAPIQGHVAGIVDVRGFQISSTFTNWPLDPEFVLHDRSPR